VRVPQRRTNSRTEAEKINSGEKFGETFNRIFEPAEVDGNYVVTLSHKHCRRLSGEDLRSFQNYYMEVLEDYENTYIGAFDLENSEGYDIDFNLVLDDLNDALEVARETGQESLWDTRNSMCVAVGERDNEAGQMSRPSVLREYIDIVKQQAE
jgi:hypothetical protein